MMWWPFIFFSLAQAEDFSVEKYCFPSPVRLEKASSQLRAITVASDRVETDGLCLVVSSRPHRRELIQRYLLSNHPDMSISFSSQELRREPCELKVEKVRDTVKNEDQIGLKKKTFIGSATDKNEQSSETFHITTLKDFELTVNQDKIQGICRYVSPERYEITLTVEKVAKPLTPPLPAGSVVVVTTPPDDQETSLLKTQLQLQRGSRIEIGSIIKELKEKSRELDAKPKIDFGKSKGFLQEKTYLSLH